MKQFIVSLFISVAFAHPLCDPPAENSTLTCTGELGLAKYCPPTDSWSRTTTSAHCTTQARSTNSQLVCLLW
ncbi:hypothetical protein BJY52DRAFT_1291846 [Lactarius psammicola]|nr:hypothetical protein BJY52DRAFT_1291846 [Lactarius psammicola]